MSTVPALTSLLPAVYRIRDDANDGVLEALLGVIEEQARALRDDIEGLYDNWFVETCDEWVVPYIGDLLGVRGLADVAGSAISRRSFVANALAYRRGKGTAATLEQVARDVTGWPTRAVEFFQTLAWTQNLNHVRLDAPGNTIVRDAAALELVEGPFEAVARTVDIRNIDIGRGRHNIPNVGIFLWRSRAYPIERSPARPAGQGRFRFHQHGADAALFASPATETGIAHAATELNVPGPIRRRALRDDLAGFRAKHLETGGPPDSDLYGPSRSIEILRGGRAVPPADVVAADLGAWDRPPPATRGLLSGDLSSFTPPSASSPEIEATIGAETRVVELGASPATLDDAAEAVQRALGDASPSAAFAGARVLVVADRLLVLPGVRDGDVTVGPTAADATTASDLRFTPPDGVAVTALMSSPLTPFPDLSASLPGIEITIAGGSSVEAPLASIPSDVASAASVLQDAVRNAGGTPAFADAIVAAAGDRLVVISGTGEPITLRPTADDPATARLLRVAPFVAVDPHLGRLAFALGDEPDDDDVLVSYRYGFPGDVGGGPYDRREGLVGPAAGVWNRTVSRSEPGADFSSLSAALTAWLDPSDGAGADAVLTMIDNDAYEEPLALAMPPGRRLVLQAATGRRPRVRFVDASGDLGELAVSGGDEDAALELDGLLLEGAVRVAAGALGDLRIRHCTFVPVLVATGEGDPAGAADPSIVVEAPNDLLNVELARCVSDPIETPPDMAGLDITDSIVHAPQVVSHPVLLSGNLASFPALSSPVPQIAVTIGGRGPRLCRLPGVPTSLSQAREMLRSALRAADRSTAFARARVVTVANRLVIVPGTPERVTVMPNESDATAAELRLVPGESRPVLAAFSGVLDPFPPLSSGAPVLAVTMGDEGPHESALASVPASIPQARDALQDAIRGAHPSPAFDGCLVAAVGDRLLVIPGAPHTPVRFAAPEADPTTVVEFGLESGGVALSGPAGDPGAPVRIRTSTVIGSVTARAVELVSESIVTDLVVAERRQVGCARFSFLPAGSIVPRRFRCQPSDAAAADRVVPSFTSLAFGHHAYAQLATSCASEITRGAEDEGEMGVWHFLQQGARLGNLRVGLDEYLRFGLEAGFFFVT